ncbi:DUF4013 domain-containing protein [Natronolimnohabitans sp. A-GB9]|uniref:DUF4013 domain-containing protein n=1 Tax=Natronolimnohabitans sp. A-GB9 TaxID=3069757 RepID=UPI0027B0886A|nr:DUF4013 domain-containing protein [Natronolimnohabitans sp. A-GB9]MDQ2049495.1 DUF4013 domain-containing protein [Natronolimnohabitans sp. A-GB9]
MLSDALTYLKDSDDVWTTTIIGGLFVLTSFLVLPLFFVWGYVVRVLERTSQGSVDPPTFGDWRVLTIDGVKTVAILLAYALIPAVVGAFLSGGVLLATGGEPGAVGAAALVASGLLVVALALAVAYTVPGALARFATERRLGAAFEVDALRPSLTTSTYAVGWLQALGIVLVGSIVAGLLGEVPVVGAGLGAIVTFYALVSAYYVIGRTWADLHPVSLEEASDESSTERPVV